MIRKNQRWLNRLNAALDWLLIVAAYLLADYLRFHVLGGVDTLGAGGIKRTAALAFATGMVALYLARGVYRSRRLGSAQLGELVLLNAGGLLTLTAVLFVLRIPDFSRVMLALLFVLMTAFELAKRAVLGRALRYFRSQGFNQKHVLLVGCGREAEAYRLAVAANPDFGFLIDGHVGPPGEGGSPDSLGSYEDLPALVERGRYDEVIIALDPQEYSWMPRVLSACEREGLRVCIVPSFNEYIPSHPTVEVMGDCKLINIRDVPLDQPFNALCKRAMDIAGALVLIALTSPVMLAAAIGVRLSSPGPVFFRQERVGKDKKTFVMYKFRSMRVNAAEGTAWSTNEDPRKTRFGAFLRKTSLDELPQFFNVLKGDMSLVGPRPEIPFHVEHFKNDIPLYMVRHQVRPGITGWAQVNGYRGDTSIEGRVRCDIWYIENWSLGLDIRILLRTAFGGMVNQEKLQG